MPEIVDARPPGLDVSFRPGTTLTVTLSWPAGALVGRTFTSTLDGVALDVAVVGDTMTVEVTDTQTGAVTEPVEWLLLEDIGGTPEPILVGTWSPSSRSSAVTQEAVTVAQGAVEVDVTVNSAQASLVALDARLDVLEAARDVKVINIVALEPPDARTNWPEDLNLANGNGQNNRPRVTDVSPGGTTQGERSHQKWMAAGTWHGIVVWRTFTSGVGTIEVLIDGVSMGSFPTIASGQDQNDEANPHILPTPVVLAASGLHTVTIRKTTAAGAVWFDELYLRKVA